MPLTRISVVVTGIAILSGATKVGSTVLESEEVT